MVLFSLENAVVVSGESWHGKLQWLVYMVGTVQVLLANGHGGSQQECQGCGRGHIALWT